MREVDIALKKISVRHHNAYAMRASLHGIKIPVMNSKPPADNSTPIDDKKAEQAMAAAIARKQQEVIGAKSK